MQLAAASQRAHAPPPPVPPRPSRQVVAEAMKKSTTRPPCPTRQAPPPPNQRPWRLEEQQKIQGTGRTIIYESPDNKKKQPINNIVNGKEAENKIEDTSKRKDDPSVNHNNNNDNSSNNNNHVAPKEHDDKCNGKSKEAKVDDSPKRTKAHNVTFKETTPEPQQQPKTLQTENCATVVVIDETESCSNSSRASASSQEEHDNIQRLDWLEAGVRYSATKITLPAEEPSCKQDDDDGEDDEFVDFDFSRWEIIKTRARS